MRNRERFGLNNNWNFTVNGTAFEKINIPHNMVDLPLNYFNEKETYVIGTYEKEFSYKQSDKRVFLIFEGVAHACKIYLNGIYVGNHLGGYTPFEFEITQLINKTNKIKVIVDSKPQNFPPFGKEMDYLTYGGIYREVYIEERGKSYIKNAFFKGIDLLTDEKKMEVEIAIENINKNSKFSIYLKKGSVYSLLATENVFVKNVVIPLTDIELWTLDNPVLYEFEIRLIEKEVIDIYNQLVGFRTIQMSNKGFFINGKKTKLLGLNRHQSYPYIGYAMPSNIQQEDARILKQELGINIVRCNYYPQSQDFLNECDKLGILVIDEIPSYNYIGDEIWQEVCKANVSDMVIADRNHPSVIMYNIGIRDNESNHLFFQRNKWLAKSLDKTRPTGLIRENTNKTVDPDIYSYNDYEYSNTNKNSSVKKETVSNDVPFLITEFKGFTNPTKIFDNPSIIQDQVENHSKAIEKFFADESILGVIGNSFTDYNTSRLFGSGDNISYYGILDMFRNKKSVANLYASQQTVKPILEVTNNFKLGDYKENKCATTLILTNCDRIDVFRNDFLIGEIRPKKSSYFRQAFVFDDCLLDYFIKKYGFSKIKNSKIKSILQITNSSVNKDAELSKYTEKEIEEAKSLFETLKNEEREKGISFRFYGYIGQKKVIELEKIYNQNTILKVDYDRDPIEINYTYETRRIEVKNVNAYGSLNRYIVDHIEIETNENLAVIGPKIVNFVGGYATFYVKTKNIGKGIIKIKNDRNSTIEINIDINKGKKFKNNF
ncbi:MAG: hypothetical protein LBV58_00820 [Acholeplasmatales bacterium]|jgi:beta-galactosidase|nr:hypothetical protein [Acholeplasmatales bacterium]